MDTPSTLPPAQVAVAMVALAVTKHETPIDIIFFKAASFLTVQPEGRPQILCYSASEVLRYRLEASLTL